MRPFGQAELPIHRPNADSPARRCRLACRRLRLGGCASHPSRFERGAPGMKMTGAPTMQLRLDLRKRAVIRPSRGLWLISVANVRARIDRDRLGQGSGRYR